MLPPMVVIFNPSQNRYYCSVSKIKPLNAMQVSKNVVIKVTLSCQRHFRGTGQNYTKEKQTEQ